MSTATTGRTGEQLRASRRRRIADEIELVALRLFAERGADAVTVDDIADAADISRRTFFRYFASKDDVLHGNHERHLETVRATLEAAAPAAMPRALVRRILLALIADFGDQREVHLLRRQIAAKNPEAFAHKQSAHHALPDAVVDSLAAHLDVDPGADLQLRVYVQAGLGAIQAAVRAWLTAGSPESLEALAGEALDLIGLTDDPA